MRCRGPTSNWILPCIQTDPGVKLAPLNYSAARATAPTDRPLRVLLQQGARLRRSVEGEHAPRPRFRLVEFPVARRHLDVHRRRDQRMVTLHLPTLRLLRFPLQIHCTVFVRLETAEGKPARRRNLPPQVHRREHAERPLEPLLVTQMMLHRDLLERTRRYHSLSPLTMSETGPSRLARESTAGLVVRSTHVTPECGSCQTTVPVEPW